MMPTVAEALTLPDFRSAFVWLPSPLPVIRPGNAASIVTKTASEIVPGNIKLARRSHVTVGSSSHLVNYR